MENGLREATWIDADGRRWVTLLPARAPDSDAVVGIPVGPPSLEELGLPLPIEVRLHNELVSRRLLTLVDLRRRPGEIEAALRAALRVDATAIVAMFKGDDAGAHDSRIKEAPANGAKPGVHNRQPRRAG